MNGGCWRVSRSRGFAGLRTEEVLRQQWSDIDWAAGEVYVRQPKRVGDWRPRHVEILPALRRHLERLALKEGKVLPGGQRTLYLLRRALMDKLGWETRPNNCLRHRFKTYHAAHFRDLPRTQLQMGHADSSLTHYVYGTPAPAGWWAFSEEYRRQICAGRLVVQPRAHQRHWLDYSKAILKAPTEKV